MSMLNSDDVKKLIFDVVMLKLNDLKKLISKIAVLRFNLNKIRLLLKREFNNTDIFISKIFILYFFYFIRRILNKIRLRYYLNYRMS